VKEREKRAREREREEGWVGGSTWKVAEKGIRRRKEEELSFYLKNNLHTI
jgi:hypothetical protein